MVSTISVQGLRGVALGADEVARVPLEPVEGVAGVRQRVLWRSGESVAGELELDPGQRLEPHAHHHAHHHQWVLEGTVHVLGRDLGPGSYIHVPAGVAHDLTTAGTSHVRLFFLYLVDSPA